MPSASVRKFGPPLDTMNKEMAASVLQEFLQPVQVLLDHAVFYLFFICFLPP